MNTQLSSALATLLAAACAHADLVVSINGFNKVDGTKTIQDGGANDLDGIKNGSIKFKFDGGADDGDAFYDVSGTVNTLSNLNFAEIILTDFKATLNSVSNNNKDMKISFANTFQTPLFSPVKATDKINGSFKANQNDLVINGAEIISWQGSVNGIGVGPDYSMAVVNDTPGSVPFNDIDMQNVAGGPAWTLLGDLTFDIAGFKNFMELPSSAHVRIEAVPSPGAVAVLTLGLALTARRRTR